MSAETRSVTWTIGKAAQTLTLNPASVTVNAGQSVEIAASWNGEGGTLSAVSSDPNVVSAAVSGRTITLTGVSGGSATITATVTATANYLDGLATAQATVQKVETGYLRFIGSRAFSLENGGHAKTWDGTLEWRNGTSDWAVWNGASISSADNIIDIRGTGNTIITGSAVADNAKIWFFSGSSATTIECEGNIETLLDYQTVKNGQHPTMGSSCFANMFQGQTKITKAPSLPSLDLASSCYSYMFVNTSITEAPALPATNIAGACYYEMFLQCSKLVSIPALPATTLKSSCYNGMFYRCSALKISATQTGDYQYAYRVPTSGTGVDGGASLADMFGMTGGTFTGTPSINTTYYTDHEPVG